MTEQTRNITEAVIAQKGEDRLMQLRKEKSLKYIAKSERHLRRLRTLHLYGSTLEEVQTNKDDAYFGTWFDDIGKGDVQVMHSILDHFEPLEIITNMGHNYRIKFSPKSALVALDFRPSDEIPNNKYILDGVEIAIQAYSEEEKTSINKSYLYSSILRIAKELILYFPMDEVSFDVNCKKLMMSQQHFDVSHEQVQHFLESSYEEDFNQQFEARVLNS